MLVAIAVALQVYILCGSELFVARLKETIMDKNVAPVTIELSDFFTSKRETEGVWFEPVVFGKRLGVEFRVLGANSDRVSIAIDEYRKTLSDIEEIVDKGEKEKAKTKAFVDNVASRITDARPVGNNTITIEGKPFAYSPDMVRTIMENCLGVASAIMSFSGESGNFTNRNLN